MLSYAYSCMNNDHKNLDMTFLTGFSFVAAKNCSFQNKNIIRCILFLSMGLHVTDFILRWRMHLLICSDT